MLFKCVNCHRTYEDLRFVWESDAAEGQANQASEDSCRLPWLQSDSDCDGWHTPTLGTEDEAEFLLPSALFRSSECLKDSDSESFEQGDEDFLLPETLVATPAAVYPDEGKCDLGEHWDSESTHAGSSYWESESSAEDAMCRQTQGMAMYGDVSRFFGTSAKIAGAIGADADVCGPVATAACAFGLASGVHQLHRGLSAPSGLRDPHLVTKGSITSALGSAKMLLCAKATLCASPPLFAAAACMCVAKTAASWAIDTNMDGLCSDCYNAERFDVDSDNVMRKA